jgi:hypothetical protein
VETLESRAVTSKKPQEQVSPGGIILPAMPKPESDPVPQNVKPERWSFIVGSFPCHSDQDVKDALEALYKIALPRPGICGSKEAHEKRERVRELLNQVAQEMVGEVPSIEELC